MNRPINPAHTASDDHDWVRLRLPAAAAGLLDDQDEQRLQAHLTACGECAAAWQEQMQALSDECADGSGGHHLPAAMIVRWELASQTLRGLEREAVSGHLARCADCRADLEALGHRAKLDPRAALADTRVVRARRTFGSGVAWGAGAVALAAMVAGLILLPAGPPEESGVLPWVAPVTLRGDGPATLELETDAKGFAILAAVPADIDRQRPAAVVVRGPQDDSLLETNVSAASLAERTLSIVIRNPRGMAPGDYRVVFSQAGPTGEIVSREVSFRIVFRER